jgi:hypothetical protein
MSNKTQSRRLSIGQRRILLSVAVLIFLAVIAANERGWFAAARSTSSTPRFSFSAKAQPPESVTASVTQQRARPIADFESELITITPHGFEPKQITRPPGRFLLMIDNRSGLALVTSRLNLGAGIGLREIALPREEPNWSEIINPQPGVYLLTEANHPTWACRIVIAPH